MSDIKIPGPSMGLNEIINALTQQLIQDRADTPSKYNPLRPSSAGKCERELGYEFMQFRGLAKYETENNSADTHRLLNLGNAVERQLFYDMSDAFKKAPAPVEIKYKQQTLSFFQFHDGTWLEGNIDGVIQTDQWKIVIDIKSKGDKYSQFYKSSWDEFVEKLENTGFAKKFGEDAVFITDLARFIETEKDVFFNNNLYQLNFYACNPFLKERGINLASIVQYNKNDSRIREIRFVPSEVVYEKTKAKFLRVAATVDQEKSVQNLNKEYVLGSQKCGFCPFKKECWPENDALKAYFKELPAKQWPKDLDRLPKDLQETLTPLFKEYHELLLNGSHIDKIELDIVKILDKAKVYKIRLNKDQIYRVRRLKSGGKGDGERMVLRRDKL